MAYSVEFAPPKRALGRETLELNINQNGKRLGRLQISKGTME